MKLSETALQLSRNVNFLLQKLTAGSKRESEEFLIKSRALVDCLFDSDLNRKLMTLPTGTCIEFCGALEVHQVPWEALAFEDQFLGERYAIGRLIDGLGSQRPDALGPPARPSGIAIADSPELLQAGVESFAIQSLLRQISWDYPDLLSEPICEFHHLTRVSALKLINETEWFHFAGHAVGQSGVRHLKINSSERLGPAEIDNLERTPSLVFLNACSAVELPRTISDVPRQQECLVNSFMKKSTRWLIGSTTPVPDWDCRLFVNSFYESVLVGNSPGQALRLARVKCRREHQKVPHLPLTFVLYGRPGVHLFNQPRFPLN